MGTRRGRKDERIFINGKGMYILQCIEVGQAEKTIHRAVFKNRYIK